MHKILITVALLVCTPLFADVQTIQIVQIDMSPSENRLIEDIFEGQWGLSKNESQVVIQKLRLLSKSLDYEETLNKIYTYSSDINPEVAGVDYWGADFDAPKADSVHKILVENDKVRILDVVFEPGQSGEFHTHKWAGIVVDLIPSDFVIHWKDGEKMFLSSTEDPVFPHFEGQAPHYAENVGSVRYEGIHFEVKN